MFFHLNFFFSAEWVALVHSTHVPEEGREAKEKGLTKDEIDEEVERRIGMVVDGTEMVCVRVYGNKQIEGAVRVRVLYEYLHIPVPVYTSMGYVLHCTVYSTLWQNCVQQRPYGWILFFFISLQFPVFAVRKLHKHTVLVHVLYMYRTYTDKIRWSFE